MTKRQLHSGGRRQDILRAALQAFTQHGVAATTVEMICAGSGASVGSIYHHFGNKDGVALELYLRGQDAHFAFMMERAAAAQDGQGVVTALVESFIDWTVDNPDWARFILAAGGELARSGASGRLAEANKQRFKALRELLLPYVEDGALRSLPMELYFPIIHGPVLTHLRVWLTGRAVTSPAEWREVFAEAAWRALAPA